MQHDVGALGPAAWLIVTAVKVIVVFTALITFVALWTWVERKVAGFIQDRLGPNRVGPWGLFQPVADGLKNILKEETYPAAASRLFFVAAPVLALTPSLMTIAVVPFASPLPTPWGLVDMVVADLPIGVLYILALTSLGVYGIVIAGWSSNNKYALLGGLRGSAQLVSYEVGMGMSLVPIFMLAGNVTLTQVVWTQQEELGLWLAFPLGLSFLVFLIAAFAETNRLPFDMPEAESELVAGYHTEYSSMKFSMFMIAEYANLTVSCAVMATLFFGGWDVPFWAGDNMRVVGPGVVEGAAPTVWKSLLTMSSFGLKTLIFVLLFMWVRWTVPRFRYDQIMHLGWKILLPVALAYIGVTGTAILVLDQLGMEYGLTYGLVLTAVNVVATAVFLWLVDRDHVMSGSWITQQKRLAAVSRRRPPGRAGEEPSREEAAWR
jgi:NADH-quinone oxidoreductase subunit H